MIFEMFSVVGDFGEDKDAAADLRETIIKPRVSSNEMITLDFDGVTLVTQSFVHALISDVLRSSGEIALDYLEFRNCVDVVKGIISTVVQYSLETVDEPELGIDDPECIVTNIGKRRQESPGIATEEDREG